MGTAMAGFAGSETCPDFEQTALIRCHLSWIFGLQVPAILAMVLGRFRVSLAEHMGGYQGILEGQLNAFTLSLKGGCWLRFGAR